MVNNRTHHGSVPSSLHDKERDVAVTHVFNRRALEPEGLVPASRQALVHEIVGSVLKHPHAIERRLEALVASRDPMTREPVQNCTGPVLAKRPAPVDRLLPPRGGVRWSPRRVPSECPARTMPWPMAAWRPRRWHRGTSLTRTDRVACLEERRRALHCRLVRSACTICSCVMPAVNLTGATPGLLDHGKVHTTRFASDDILKQSSSCRNDRRLSRVNAGVQPDPCRQKHHRLGLSDRALRRRRRSGHAPAFRRPTTPDLPLRERREGRAWTESPRLADVDIWCRARPHPARATLSENGASTPTDLKSRCSGDPHASASRLAPRDRIRYAKLPMRIARVRDFKDADDQAPGSSRIAVLRSSVLAAVPRRRHRADARAGADDAAGAVRSDALVAAQRGHGIAAARPARGRARRRPRARGPRPAPCTAAPDAPRRRAA